ncbi:MAG TPA: 16S rRNA (guanine(966)-N(2))-methyltransferase RsmD [Burkholderiales bacterium]
MRIIAGEHRGRRIAVPARPGVRPTPDRVRETLFNWLGQRLDGLTCLDLFAGSGALGFEAASRGAARVVLVEQDREAFQALLRTKELLRMTQAEIVHEDAFAYLRRGSGEFDLVFLDPPFRQNALGAALVAVAAHVVQQGRVYVEAPGPVDPGAPWHEIRRSRAGQVSYQLLEKR